MCGYSNESCLAVLSCSTVYYAYNLLLTSKSVNKTVSCNQSNKSCLAVLSCGSVCHAGNDSICNVCG